MSSILTIRQFKSSSPPVTDCARHSRGCTGSFLCCYHQSNTSCNSSYDNNNNNCINNNNANKNQNNRRLYTMLSSHVVSRPFKIHCKQMKFSKDLLSVCKTKYGRSQISGAHLICRSLPDIDGDDVFVSTENFREDLLSLQQIRTWAEFDHYVLNLVSVVTSWFLSTVHLL